MSWGGAAAGLTALVLALERRQLVGVFEKLESTSPETARTRQELGLRESRVFKRLARRGVLRSTGEARYYLDRDALSEQRRRRWAVLAAVAALVIAGAVFLLLGTA